MKLLIWLWWKLCGLGRRLWLALAHVNDPWDGGKVDLKDRRLRKLLADSIRADRRERGVRIVRRFSRDPVVERRERLLESRAKATRAKLKLVG